MAGITTILTEYEKSRRQPGFVLNDFVAFYKRYNKVDESTLLALVGAETQFLARNGRLTELSKLEGEFPDLASQRIRKEIADSLSEFLEYYCPLTPRIGSLPREDGGFRFVREIGRGGEGVVYEAIEIPIQRSVAVKFAFPMSTGLKMEATILGQLQHPNIPTLYSYGELYDLPCFVFQLIRGTSLKAQCYHHRGLPISNAVSMLRKIGSAVEACHSQGIVHCDLNLTNVITVHGTPYLVDFGQARYSTSPPNRFFGTPGRIPPEYSDLTAIISPILADVFCLGIMLYELLTQTVPQFGNGKEAIKLTPPSELQNAIDPELDEICLTAIAPPPAERFQSVKQFNSALSSWSERNQRLGFHP